MSSLLWLLVFPYVYAQNISSSLAIPPLQWLNLNQLWDNSGAEPPPLRDAHMAYDPVKRVLVVFGGESSAGNPTQQTYILELDTLTWRAPLPPDGEQGIPPPRSAGAFGTDSASNDREGLLVWGGKGGTGTTPLDDLWYYHFQYEFWVPIDVVRAQNPVARWGTINGAAPQSSFQNTETYLWIAGGVNDTHAYPLGEVWQLNVTGVIAAGSNTASGAWSELPNNAQSAGIPQTARYGAAGTAIPPINNSNREGTLVAFGGCDTSPAGTYNATCGQPDAEILTLPTNPSQTTAQWQIAAECPPGAYAASLAPNRNAAATTFSSQVFLFPGAVDSSMWNDTSQDGEIGILVSTSGVWARVLPAEDPQSAAKRPSPKAGATVFSYTSSITGYSGAWSDTIVFGGKDMRTGQLTNEMWILRAYNAAVQSSGQHWPGYQDGQLQSGLNASGAGVTVQFFDTCAQRLSPPGGSSSTPSNPSSPQLFPHDPNVLDHSPVNQYLSTSSIVLLLLGFLLYRAASSSPAHPLARYNHNTSLAAAGIAAVGYALGIVGFAIGTKNSLNHSMKNAVALKRRSARGPFVPTGHAQASLVLFIALYVILPAGAVILYFSGRPRRNRVTKSSSRPSLRGERKDTDETIAPTVGSRTPAEKDRLPSHFNDDQSALMQLARISSEHTPPEVVEDDGEEFPSRHAQPKRSGESSFFAAISNYRNRTRRKSETMQSLTSPSPPVTSTPSPPSGFEVVNRPKKAQSMSTLFGGSQLAPSVGTHVPRNPSELSWMERRRSVNMFGQMDYELTHRGPTTPGVLSPDPQSDAHEMSPTTQAVPADTPPSLPQRVGRICFNVIVQVVITWALAFWIVTFAIVGSGVGIALMVVCTLAYYAGLIALAIWRLPHQSILAVVVTRLRSDPAAPTLSTHPAVNRPTADNTQSRIRSSLGRHHPYMHTPPRRASPLGEEDVLSRSTHGARSMDSDPIEDDEDDDTRQARMEGEMARRDVSIFTVPKRRLMVRN